MKRNLCINTKDRVTNVKLPSYIRCHTREYLAKKCLLRKNYRKIPDNMWQRKKCILSKNYRKIPGNIWQKNAYSEKFTEKYPGISDKKKKCILRKNYRKIPRNIWQKKKEMHTQKIITENVVTETALNVPTNESTATFDTAKFII